MATDSTISNLTQNPSIEGTEEIAIEKNGANFKNTFNELKSFIGVSDNNIDGGNSQSIYLTSQIIDGGNSI